MKYFYSSESIQNIIDNCGGGLNIIVLKGSCPMIKSRLMKSLAGTAEAKGLTSDFFLSPLSYENNVCVYIKGNNSLICDSEYFTDSRGNAKLYDIDSICGLQNDSKIISDLKKRKGIFLSYAAKEKNSALLLERENRRLSSKYISKPKILNYILRFISRNKLQHCRRKGEICTRFLSSVTAWGVHSLYETVFESCERIFTLSGKVRGINSMLISGLSEAFLQYGYNVTVFKCSLTGESEHLCIPELSLAFFSDNDYHTLPYGRTGEIHTERFFSSEIPSDIRFRMMLNNEHIDDYISNAVFSAYDALEMQSSVSDMFFDDENDCFYEKLNPMIISAVFGNN